MGYYLTRDSELYHYGISGMKWGVRRWQNKDGTYTPEGREHYGFGEARKTYKDTVRKAKSDYIKRNASILSKEERRKRSEILDKAEYLRSSRENKLLADYDYRLATERARNRLAKKETIREAKRKYKSTPEYKKRRAIIIGSTIVGAALSVYGGYKVKKYIGDQKKIMDLREKAETLKRLIPQYEANIEMLKADKNAGSTLKEYVDVANKHKSDLKDINDNIDALSKKHLYNFGKKMTKEQYNRGVQNASNAVKKAGKTAAKSGKSVLDYILDNSDSIKKLMS